MIRKYPSMPSFLLHQALETVQGQRRRGLGVIHRKNGPTSIILDIGRRPSRDGSLIITPDTHALRAAAGTAAGLLLVTFTAGGILYHLFGRRR